MAVPLGFLFREGSNNVLLIFIKSLLSYKAGYLKTQFRDIL